MLFIIPSSSYCYHFLSSQCNTVLLQSLIICGVLLLQNDFKVISRLFWLSNMLLVNSRGNKANHFLVPAVSLGNICVYY